MQWYGGPTDMLTWTLQTFSTVGKTAASVRIAAAESQHAIRVPLGDGELTFDAADHGSLILDYFSKTEGDTLLDANGSVVADTMWRIKKMWCDGILLESWFQNAAIYHPRYFYGFLQQQPDAPNSISAPYQFNFPGAIKWIWSGTDFWQWYFEEKNRREVINFLDKDPDRVWKFRGATESCQDLVTGIKEILRL